MDGKLELIIGCMYSGKTKECINRANRYLAIDKKVCVINHSSDINRNNTDTELVSHDNIRIPAYYTEKIMDIYNTMMNFDIIIVNEGQFFEDLYHTIINLVDNQKKIVIVSGLDGDYKKNKFGSILDLVPHAEEVFRLHAYCAKCKDGTPGIFSARIINDESQILVGGKESYIPVCRKHYNEMENNE